MIKLLDHIHPDADLRKVLERLRQRHEQTSVEGVPGDTGPDLRHYYDPKLVEIALALTAPRIRR